MTNAWPLVLSIDWGMQSVKYLVLRRIGKRIRIESFGQFPVVASADDVARQQQQIFQTIFQKEKKYRGAKIVLGIETVHTLIKQEAFPPLSRKELFQSAFFSIQKELSEAASIVFDVLPVDSAPNAQGNINYLLMGASEEAVQDKIQYIINQKRIPVKVLPSVIAARNLFEFLPSVEPKETVCILDVGSAKTVLMFFRSGWLDFYREIVVGGDDFTKAISGTIFHEGRAIQFSTQEAVTFKKKYGYTIGFTEGMSFRGAPFTEIGTMMRPILERLIGEIHRSIGFYKESAEGNRVSSIYLIGGGSKLKNLPDLLAEKLGVPVQLIPKPPKLSIGGEKKAEQVFQSLFPEYAISLALAMETDAKGNLLPESFKKMHQLSVIQKWVNLAAFILFGVLFVMLAWLLQGKNNLEGELPNLQSREMASKSAVSRFEAVQRQKAQVDSSTLEIDGKLQQNPVPVQVLRLVSNRLPKSLSLRSLYIGRDMGLLKEDIKVKLLKGGTGGNAPASGGTTNPNEGFSYVYLTGTSKASVPDIR
ncbi:MAG TPA: pilus assembly protein PilM, partial [bacterium]